MNFNPVTQDPLITDKEFPSSMMPISLMNNGVKIIGTYFLAAGKGPHPLVLLLHGFPGNETNYDIAHAVRRFGFNVFVFHYRGSWGSGGNFNWTNSLEDVQFVLDEIKLNRDETLRLDPEKIILVGHSMGGFASLLTAVNNSEIKNAASLAGFNLGFFGKFLKENPQYHELTKERLAYGTAMLNGTSPSQLLDEMIANYAEWNLMNYADELIKKNILLIGAKFDTVAIPELHHYPLHKVFETGAADNFEHYELNAGHSFSDSRIRVTEILINWLIKIKF